MCKWSCCFAEAEAARRRHASSLSDSELIFIFTCKHDKSLPHLPGLFQHPVCRVPANKPWPTDSLSSRIVWTTYVFSASIEEPWLTYNSSSPRCTRLSHTSASDIHTVQSQVNLLKLPRPFHLPHPRVRRSPMATRPHNLNRKTRQLNINTQRLNQRPRPKILKYLKMRCTSSRAISCSRNSRSRF
jgi:hypothetical protein